MHNDSFYFLTPSPPPEMGGAWVMEGEIWLSVYLGEGRKKMTQLHTTAFLRDLYIKDGDLQHPQRVAMERFQQRQVEEPFKKVEKGVLSLSKQIPDSR